MSRILKTDNIIIFVVSVIASCFTGWLFYDMLAAGLILFAPTYILFKKVYGESKRKKWKRDFELQFEEALGSLVSALRAGYSVENSFFEISKQLGNIYGKEAYIMKELRIICHGLSVNMPVEKLVKDMAVRTDVAAVSEFADMLVIAKKSGGNFIEVTRQHENILHEKRQVLNEIETVISAKKCESLVMNIMPAGMLIYLRITSGQLVQALYSGTLSHIIMTALLCLYIAAIALGRHITDFECSKDTVKDKPVLGKKRIKNRKGCADVIASKIYSLLTGTFFSTYIIKMNNNIKVFSVNALNETVIKDFWSALIKKILLGVLAAFVIVSYSVIYDRKNIAFYIIISAVVIYIVPYSVVSNLKSKAEKRKSQMMSDYPELVDRLSLLIGAGLSVKGCFIKIAGEYMSKRKSGLAGYRYVYEEIIYMARQLENGIPETTVYEQFGKRSGILSYMKLCTILTQNLKKGSRDILDKLRVTSLDALEERKNIMKSMGERASSKLLMPMMMQFIMIIVIIMYPAIMSM
ncbi:MAG: hypothetical protein HFH14_03815 [Lachnospiraceae bacterium]|nr:hypothetical protein [Lachnospiraceae bacterium]